MKTLLLATAVAALTTSLSAQISMAPASPFAKTTQQVGLAEVQLEYSRPSAKGRPIFGGIISYGKIWRTGANASTKLGFDRDVRFGGEEVPAGTYALYTIPGERSWTVILYKNTELWGAGGYDAADDLLRIDVPVTRLAERVESLSIDFQGFDLNGAELVIRWDDTQVAVPVFVDSDAAIFAEIDAKVVNATGEVTAQDYFSAAMFYHAKKRELVTAARWMDAALEQQPEAFWMVLGRAQLAFDMGDLERAKSAATRTRELAAAYPAGDFGYVAKSELLLAKIASTTSEGRAR